MLKLLFGVGLIAFTLFTACDSSQKSKPSGRDFSIRWGQLGNQPPDRGASQRLLLTNLGSSPLQSSGWSLYFNSSRALTAGADRLPLTLTHINGDFYSLAPTPDFASLDPGRTMEIPFESDVPYTNASGAPIGFYFVFEEEGRQSPPEAVSDYQILPFQSEEPTRNSESGRMEVPSAESVYQENEKVSLLGLSEIPPILPQPVSFVAGKASLLLDTVRVHFQEGLEGEASYLTEALRPFFSAPIEPVQSEQLGSDVIRLELGPLVVDGRDREAYRLSIDPDHGIKISGADRAGVFYGIQTLRGLIPPEADEKPGQPLSLPALVVEDAPRFSYRGLHLDVARNFHSKESVEKLLELMSFYKLNRFHFHLSDDEGWRLEIHSLPELVEVGSRRGHTVEEREYLIPSYGSGPQVDTPPGSGHYSRQEFIEILKFAARRHIQVMPEIDVPGHARAALKAMQARYHSLLEEGRPEEAEKYLLSDLNDRSQYRSVQGWNDNVINVCRESSYRFLQTVIDEIIRMYKDAGAPLEAIHIGGDEVPVGVWEDSPLCRSFLNNPGEGGPKFVSELFGYFLDRVNHMISERGLVTAGWEEVALRQVHGQGAPQPNPAFVGRNVRAYVWNSVWGSGGEENAYRLANAGYPVVLCNASNLYFDLAYDPDPREPGYHWAGYVDTRKVWEFSPFDLYASATTEPRGRPIPESFYKKSARLAPSAKANILGIQGEMWSENARTQEVLEYLLFPKLLALAERAWAREAEWESIDEPQRQALQNLEWNRFANRLGRVELPRLNRLAGGVNYRIPPPVALVSSGLLKANVTFPGLEIRFTTDGAEPTLSSQKIEEPIEISLDPIKLKAFDRRGRSSRTTELRNLP